MNIRRMPLHHSFVTLSIVVPRRSLISMFVSIATFLFQYQLLSLVLPCHHFCGVGTCKCGECSGLVVECLTQDQEVAGDSLVSLSCVLEQDTLIPAYYLFNP